MKNNTNILKAISDPENIKKVIIGTAAIVALIGIGCWGAVIKTTKT